MTRAILTLILTLAFVASPYFTEPFMGYTADQLPIPQVDPPVQPAGYAFAIWGLIYGWLIVSAVFGLWKRGTDAGWEILREPLIVSLALGVPWLWVANNSPIGATVLIIAMAAFAIIAAVRAPSYDRWLAFAPVAIFAGWLTAASWVSLGSTAAGYGILTDGIGWAYLGIAGAGLTALGVMGVLRHRAEYAATVAWALVGIIVANYDARLAIAGAAAAAIVVLAARAYPKP